MLSGVDNTGEAGTAIALTGSGLGVVVGGSSFAFGGFKSLDVVSTTDPTNTGAFLTNTKLMGMARKTKDGESRHIPLAEIFHDRNVAVSNQVAAISAAQPLIYGAWNNLIVGYWSGVDILLNPYHSDVASKGGVKQLVSQEEIQTSTPGVADANWRVPRLAPGPGAAQTRRPVRRGL